MIRPGLVLKRSGGPFNAPLFYFTTSMAMTSAVVLAACALFVQHSTPTVYVVTIYLLVWISASMLFRLFLLLAAKDPN